MQLNIDGYDVTIKAKYYGFGKCMERHAEGAERVYRDLSAAVYKNRTWQS